MRKIITKYRGFRVTNKEIIADFIFLLVSFLISSLLIYFFKLSNITSLKSIDYITGSLCGAIFGFFIIKIFLIGLKEEIEDDKNKKRK